MYLIYCSIINQVLFMVFRTNKGTYPKLDSVYRPRKMCSHGDKSKLWFYS